MPSDQSHDDSRVHPEDLPEYDVDLPDLDDLDAVPADDFYDD